MNPHTLETPAATVCSHCNLNDGWILHNVKHRGAFRRLCTNCVLKLHSSSFCAICFSLYDRPKKPSSIPGAAAASAAPSLPIIRSTLSCFKCGSFSHTSCVPPNAPKSPYLCPTCSNPHSKLFEFRKLSINDRTNISDRREEGHGIKASQQQMVIDLKASKAFLAAARIAANSMNDEVEIAQAEAERRVKELVMARKRARDALENVALICAKERGRSRQREGIGEAARVSNSAAVPVATAVSNMRTEPSGTGNGFSVKNSKNYPAQSNGGKRLVNVGGKRIERGALVPAAALVGEPKSPVSVHKNYEEGSNVAGEMEAKLLLVSKDAVGNGLPTAGSEMRLSKKDDHGGNGL